MAQDEAVELETFNNGRSFGIGLGRAAFIGQKQHFAEVDELLWQQLVKVI